MVTQGLVCGYSFGMMSVAQYRLKGRFGEIKIYISLMYVGCEDVEVV